MFTNFAVWNITKTVFAYIKDCYPALTNTNVKNVKAKTKEVVHLKFLIFTGSVATVSLYFQCSLNIESKYCFVTST